MGQTPLRAERDGGGPGEWLPASRTPAALADQDTDPPEDLAGTKEYRRHLVKVLTKTSPHHRRRLISSPNEWHFRPIGIGRECHSLFEMISLLWVGDAL